MRPIIAGCVVVLFGFGTVLADDFIATITKVETKGDKTIISGKKGKKDDLKDFTLTVAKDAKINKAGKFNKEDKKFEVGDPIKDGFKDEIFKDLAEKPVRAFITTDAKDNVTQILVLKGKKGKGNLVIPIEP